MKSDLRNNFVLASALIGGVALSWKFFAQQPPINLRGKVAVVTGATTGIGEAVVHMLAAEGVSVVLVGRDSDELTIVESAVTKYNVPTLCIPADVTRDGEVDILVSTVMEHFGQIDILVNNTATIPDKPLQDIEPRHLRNIVAGNLYAPMRLSQRVLPIMKRQGGGHIVNVASMTGTIAAPGETVCAATKAGLTAFSDALRRELAGTGIQVSIVLPGWAHTPGTDEFDKEKFIQQGVIVPLVSAADPVQIADDIVEAIRYNRREVVAGGLKFKLRSIPNRVAVPLVDWYFKLFGHSAEMVSLPEGVDAP